MKIMPNKKYNTIALYAVIVIAVNVLLIVAILKFSAIAKGFNALMDVLSPVIWGLIIAFLMNPIMVNTEKLFRKKADGSRSKLVRALSVTVAALVFLGIVAGLLAIVIPELVKSVTELFNNMGDIRDKLEKWIASTFKSFPSLVKTATEKIDDFTKDASVIFEKMQPMLDDLVSGAWGVLSFLKDFALGFIVSIYMLCNKETLLAQIKKTIISVTKKSTCAKIMTVSSQANKVFSGFITGKIIDSIIIGIICFIAMTILKLPMAMMISVVVGVTNIIPFFGPFIGAVPSALLLVLIKPMAALEFIILIIVLQQLDGNIIGPKILGKATKLASFWVMFAIIVGGGLFGFLGMILGVPVFAVFYTYAARGINKLLKKKNIDSDTLAYEDFSKYGASKTELFGMERVTDGPEETKDIIS